MSMHILVEHVLQTAKENSLWNPHDTIIVAVSGGPDSVALLHVMHEISYKHTPLNLICAHIHHGLRIESDDEAVMVQRMAEGLGIPFVMEAIDVPAYMKESGKGVEEAARVKRYEFLMRTATEYGSRSIALAHHADDQAETVLLHLLRGSGPSGLVGMKLKRTIKNMELIRPLLRIYKTDLMEVCETENFQYVIDQSNLETKHRRNAIRLDILPYLGQYNGQITQSLNQLSNVMTAEDEYVELAAEEKFLELVQRSDGRFTFGVPSFLGLHVALQRRLIKLILNYMSVDSEIIDYNKVESLREAITSSLTTTWSRDLGGGYVCIREYDVVTLQPKSKSHMQRLSYTYQVSTAVSEHMVSEIGKVLKVSIESRTEMSWSKMEVGQYEAMFDADQIVFPLTVRCRQDGDTIKVMGLNGSKKVKNIFIDDKIPPSLRTQIPMILDGNNVIIWIPGIRRSIHAPIHQQTTSVLHLSLEDT
ncbi:tRNA lysidine(34) synthetase TilS [Paenibacillus crassostreae]|uniref:tRNA(Ile)-lysidine synthase n=1 Tax=Paenibacillus crassostreae TaxID=1763538 RepID=A0A167AMX7_9BACL|nr:tRNA lysidine(34) synthetase TilS [Paenibacillus crassostreae]AOZ92802.1 tRNA lysidine(34) synthetase TilS [Paenibacillus crassostreae]OAB71224.1 tRNA(Ile)-lysidine synthetase [Paenibacillus crassostreae]